MFEEIRSSGMDFSQAKARPGSPEDRLPIDKAPAATQVAMLDQPEFVALHRKLLGYHQNELERQAENRMEMARDEDFYDNIQWDERDAQVLKDRGQIPLVYNVIASAINWVIGTEKRGRSDFKVLPRRKEASKPAEQKTQLLKYLSDVNRSAFHTSRAFEDAVKVGIGWLECGAQDDDDGEPVYDRYESWRNMTWDSAATELDLSDARYINRFKWLDEDVAVAMFPQRKGTIQASCVDGPLYGTELVDGDDASDSLEENLRNSTALSSGTIWGFTRRRVRVIETWFRTPSKVKRLQRGEFSGDVYEPDTDAHVEAVETGQSIVVEKVMMRMHVALMTVKGLLHVSETPYRHNRFPLTPIWAYRRGRDGMPYGMIRGMRDIQQDINKRAAKALAIISSNKVIMDEDAVEDIDAFAEEVARPDAILVKKTGKQLEINADRELAAAHMEMMSRSIMMVQSQSGVTDELMGRTTNATSGKAIESRQSQGGMVTAGLFDNLRLGKQVHGEKQLSLIEQFFSEKKCFRITNMRGTPDWVSINDGLPEDNITRTKADYVIGEQDWRATIRQAQVEELLALLMKLAPASPQIALVMLDLIVEGMDVPSREELVRRIRQVTGQRDPDAEEPTPEEVAQAQAKAKQDAMNERMAMAKIAETEANAAQKQAQADKVKTDAQAVLATMAGTNVATQKAALEAALAILTAPPAVSVADGVLHEAGFKSRSEGDVEQAASDAVDSAQAKIAQEQQAAQAAQSQNTKPQTM